MTQETVNNQRPRRRVTLALRAALLIVVLLFVGSVLYRSILEVDWSIVVIRPGLIVSGAMIILAASLVGSRLYQGVYRRLGSNLSLSQAFVLLTVPPLGKYLPGKVLSMAGHAALARSFSIPIRVSGSAIVLIMGLGLAAATLLGLVLVTIQAHRRLDWEFLQFGLPVGAALIVMLILLHPAIYWRVVNFALRLLRQPRLEVNLSLGKMMGLFFGFLIQLGLYICGASVMVLGIVEMPSLVLPTIIGASCLASVAGFVAVFAPAGIGVYEGILLVMLTPVIGAGAAGIVAILMRLAQTAADLSLAAAGLITLQWLRRRRNG
ncbi:MAG: flippase-like domain-containing protein [Deltaproteobacteria bacterium]|nr:flippase-like domain-containing protein [Deltaproteobacteria bacterium]